MDPKQRARYYQRLRSFTVPNKNSGMQASLSGSMDQKDYVLALDVGTTNLRCHVYTKTGAIKGSCSKRIELLYPGPGLVEMEPEPLVMQAVDCIKESIRAAGLSASEIKCLGITTQRATFLTWDKDTGKPFHNFITWRDLRARDHVKSWNNSLRLKALNKGSSLLYTFLRQPRMLAASVLKFMSNQVTLRLIWAMENIEQLKLRLGEDGVMFGCIDTWLLWKLTGEKVFATDYSNASGTGLYDPFQLEWSSVISGLLNIPLEIFPEVRDTCGDFGKTDPSLIGAAIPITAVVSDQMAAMFGECCFEVGDIKITMGTGSFLDLNTGSSPHASISGLYPQIGWKIGAELVYVAEGCISDTGTTIEWAQSMGFFDDVSELSNIAQSVPDSNGVCFVASFSGIQAPINDDKAATSIIGLHSSTKKSHIVRAMLEGIAFRFKILYEAVLSETKIELSFIRADGGVCNNDFLLQLMSDLTGQHIDRAAQRGNMTSLGAAFMAGLQSGVWQNKSELCQIRQSQKAFSPNVDTWHNQYKDVFTDWERAVKRSKEWYLSE